MNAKKNKIVGYKKISKMERYYFDTMGNDDEAYKEAIDFACKYANENEGEFKIILYALTKGNIDWLERNYKPETIQRFRQGYKFSNCNATIKIETRKTLKNNYGSTKLIVIAMGMHDDDVFSIEDIYGVEVIIVIPWLRDKLDKWVKSLNPKELRGKKTEIFDDIDCLIKQALTELTDSINLSTGITHPSDEELAKTIVRTFFKYDMNANADQIEGYLIGSKGWYAKDAKKFTDLIRRMDEGRYFKGGRKTGLQYKIKSWKEKCK